MGRMEAVFKADGQESLGAYSISEWWLDPNTAGPPAHKHPEDHVFYVITGTLDLLVDGEWSKAESGSYVLIPGGMRHTFENRGAQRAGVPSSNAPGGFDDQAQPIADWLANNPLGDARSD
jgi:mannose-6-phosphate isomerase-like protein (cupin superfamily)